MDRQISGREDKSEELNTAPKITSSLVSRTDEGLTKTGMEWTQLAHNMRACVGTQEYEPRIPSEFHLNPILNT